MKKHKGIKDLYKQFIVSVDMTEEQTEFLLESYIDEDTIVGIHNTMISNYKLFFENGLYNQNYMGENSDELSNTVMYTDLFPGLMTYPNGDGEKRGETAIILKIPKKVFTKEQGIFETLKDGKYGIPPQFIVGAFREGKVYANEKYDKQYTSKDAIKCIDTVNFQDKTINAKIFRQLYKPRIRQLKEYFRSMIKKIGKRNQKPLLECGNSINTNKIERKQFYNYLTKGTPTLEEQKNNTNNYISKTENDKKVIFLDVDGVLNSHEYFEKIRGQNIEGIESEVDVEKIGLLKKAIDETGAKVVLSSSWRNTTYGIDLKQLLLQYEITADSTPFLDNKRGEEIKKWLEENPNTEDFIILDDEIFDSYDEELMKKLIKVSNGNGKNIGEGLQQKDVEEIIKRFGRKRQMNEDELDKEGI